MIAINVHKKSSYSNGNGCVEVCFLDDTGLISLRDSKDLRRAEHLFTPVEWNAFLAGVRNGEFDLS